MVLSSLLSGSAGSGRGGRRSGDGVDGGRLDEPGVGEDVFHGEAEGGVGLDHPGHEVLAVVGDGVLQVMRYVVLSHEQPVDVGDAASPFQLPRQTPRHNHEQNHP